MSFAWFHDRPSVHGWSVLDGTPREPYELDPAARTDTSLSRSTSFSAVALFLTVAAANAQLVCTVHDATLLGRTHIFQPLERDQVRI